MKKTICFLLTIVALFAAIETSAVNSARGDKSKKGSKKVTTEQSTTAKPAPKVSKYDKLFTKDKSCRTVKGGFITFHIKGQKVYMELAKKYFGRDMLVATTISSTSDNTLGAVGFKPKTPLHVKFTLADSLVQMRSVQVKPDYNKADSSRVKAFERNSVDPVFKAFKQTCLSPDSSAVVFDATVLFSSQTDRLAPLSDGTSGGIKLTVKAVNDAMAILGAKSYDDNASVLTELSYTVSQSVLGLFTISKDQPVTVTATRTILLLPERVMRPRLADSRVGIFLTDRINYDTETDMSLTYSVINRWRIEPSDSAAWLRGEKVTPVRQIVYYLDDALPQSWREPARRGIMRWNAAFEKIGFKDVMVVKDFPKDDKSFDPDNLKYSCVRYGLSTTANAMGPSWIDPRSGEIINASVIVYSDVVKLINSWRFSQTAQVDERVRGKRMPDDVMAESVEYVLAHEVGHTLGFMHNMAASAAYAVDSLRSRTFTAENGTTASIMDYARFNYVAQPSDKGVGLTPPYLGAYDYFLIKYAYCPLPAAASFKGEASMLEGWIAEHKGDKTYRYGCQQVRQRYDPSAIEEDLGDDPLRAGDYGIANLKYILLHFNEWLTDEMDADGSYRTFQYGNILRQYNRYMQAAMLQIGGIYLTRTTAAEAAQSAVPVSGKVQCATVKWLQRQLDDSEWLRSPSEAEKMQMRIDRAELTVYNLTTNLMNSYKNIAMSSYLADGNDAYTMRNWLDDMYAWTWKPTIASAATTPVQRSRESAYLDMLLSVVKKPLSTKSASVRIDDFANLPSVDQIIALGLDESGTVERYADLMRDADNEFGSGYVASQLWQFGPSGYGWQRKVDTKAVDELYMQLFGEVKRIERLLRNRVGTATADTRSHYEMLLHLIDAAINQK